MSVCASLRRLSLLRHSFWSSQSGRLPAGLETQLVGKQLIKLEIHFSAADELDELDGLLLAELQGDHSW